MTAEFAQIYVACALTNVDEAWRPELQKDCGTIVDCVYEHAAQREWRVVAYDPITRTPPWEGGSHHSPYEVWDIDTTKVGEEADAVIIHGFRGGSTGVGIELQLAFSRGIPVLYLHHETSPVSRMIRGMPGLITIEPYHHTQQDARAALRHVVLNWLDKWKPVIEEGVALRERTSRQFAPLREALSQAWDALGPEDQRRTAALARMTQPEAARAVSRESRLAVLSAGKLEALRAALAPPRRAALTGAETKALAAAARENGWGEEFCDTLAEAALRARGEAARGQADAPVASRENFPYRLNDLVGWADFAADWQRGTRAR